MLLAGVRPAHYPSLMLARTYFQLVDAIAAVCTDAELSMIRDRVAVIPMHPLERRALVRQLRARERTLELEIAGL